MKKAIKYLLILIYNMAIGQTCPMPLIENHGTMSHSPIITGTYAKVEIHNHYSQSISPDANADALLAQSERLIKKEEKLRADSISLMTERKKFEEDKQKLEIEKQEANQSKMSIEEIQKAIFDRLQEQNNRLNEVRTFALSLSKDNPTRDELLLLASNAEMEIKSATCLSQDYSESVETFKDKNSEKIYYAYPIDKIKNDPNYIFVDNFREELARAKKFNKYGFIGIDGENIIGFMFDYALSFNGGFCFVKINSIWYYIDKAGKKNQVANSNNIIEIVNLSNGVSKAKIFRTGLETEEFAKWVLIDKFGEIISEKYDFIDALKFNNQYYLAKNGGDIGLIDHKGKVIVPITYREIKEINEHIIDLIHNSDDTHLYSLYDNKVLFKNVIVEKDTINSLLFIKTRAGYFGLIKENGKLLLDTIFKPSRLDIENRGIYSFTNNNEYLWISTGFERMGVAKRDGSIIVPPIYKDIIFSYDPKIVIVAKEVIFNEGKKNKKNKADNEYRLTRYGVVDYNQKVIVDFTYGLIKYIDLFGTKLLCCNGDIQYKSCWGGNCECVLLSPNGTELTKFKGTISPEERDLMKFDETKIKIKFGDNYNLIDKSYRILLKTNYTKILYQDNHFNYIVKDGNFYALVDSTGKRITSVDLDSIIISGEPFYWIGQRSKEKNGLLMYALIDREGTQFSDFIYSSPSVVVGSGCSIVNRNENFGVVDSNGAEILPCIFTTVQASKINVFSTSLNMNTFLIDSKGNCIENCDEYNELLKAHYKQKH